MLTRFALCIAVSCSVFAADAYPAPAPTPTPAPAAPIEPRLAKVAKKSGVKLGNSGMTLSYEPAGEGSIQMEVTVEDSSWIGIGLASGDSASMTGSGGGSDIVTCSDSGVKRFFVTGYALTGGEAIPGATCTQDSGKTVLSFQRSLAAEGRRLQTEIGISLGAPQQLIYARGASGLFTLSQHPGGEMRGGDRIDFASGDITASAKRSGELILWLHLSLMSVAWGALLPLGAIIAKRFKDGLGGKWIEYHRDLQMTGWLLQIGGFIVAILYVEEFSSHFHTIHSMIGLCVVVIGTLQPLNAVFRPHPAADGEEKAQARTIWEWIHKGLGWSAIVLGSVNIILGMMLLMKKGYDTTTIVVAVVITVVTLTAPFGLIFSCLPGNGKAAVNKSPV